MTDAAPHDPVVETAAATPRRRRISAVWLVPLIALAISLVVAWRSYSERGPVIEITLESGAGIEAGKTQVRFRDVAVGLVETLDFTPDLRRIVVTARIDKDMARYLDDSAQFWVVRPSVTAQGVTGIETVISGVYIEAYWSGEAGPRVSAFTALPRPPLTPAGQPGLRVRLRAPDGGSIATGAPVLYKRIPVGRVEAVELDPAGDVMVDLFVNAPYDAFVTAGSRFWNASGFSINLGAGGASLNVESLVSLLQGGVAFAQVGSDLAPAASGAVFELYASETAARQNVIEDLPGARLTLSALFDASVAGLAPGARVDFRGVTVGEVTAFQPVVLREADGPQVAMRVTFDIVPQRLGVPPDAADPREAGLDLLADLVERGLRVRLASSGLLSQSLHLELAELPDAAPAAFLPDAEPDPVVPAAPAETSGLAASAEGVMNRLAALPVEELMTTFTTLLANVNALLSEEGFRRAPANIGALIADIREMVETSGIRETPARIAETLASIQAVVGEVETREVMAAVAATLDATRQTVERFGVAAESLPPLVDELRAVTGRAAELPLESFVASATRTVDGIDALVRSEGVAAMPSSVDAALVEARGLIADLRASGSVENAAATLASLRQLADELRTAELGAEVAKAVAAAERAAANVESASAGLPALVETLRGLSANVEALPLEDLVASATATLATAEAILAAEGMDRVPAELSGALAQTRLLVEELREGGAVANVNATLASADQAAEAIRVAAAQLPALIARIDAVSRSAEAAAGNLGPGSELTRETQMLLRDLRSAAQSVNALVLALERRPNSVLFGR